MKHLVVYVEGRLEPSRVDGRPLGPDEVEACYVGGYPRWRVRATGELVQAQ